MKRPWLSPLAAKRFLLAGAGGSLFGPLSAESPSRPPGNRSGTRAFEPNCRHAQQILRASPIRFNEVFDKVSDKVSDKATEPGRERARQMSKLQGSGSCRASPTSVSRVGTMNRGAKRAPHPGPLPSDGRGRRCARVWRGGASDLSRTRAMISLSRRTGQGEGPNGSYWLSLLGRSAGFAGRGKHRRQTPQGIAQPDRGHRCP